MNWGHKLTIGMVLFMCVIIAMVIVSVAQGEIQLVTKNYYEEELKYQQVIDQVGNTRAIAKEKVMSFKGNSKTLSVDLGDFKEINKTNISLRMYRPSDAKLDKKLSITLNEDQNAQILLDDFNSGLWKLQLDWEDETKKFTEILTVVIP